MLIDGHDLRSVTQRSLRDQLAVVPQEGHLFAGTVAENLAFGRPEATDEELYAAAAAVGAGELIAGLPDGMDTVISEKGSGLSAGQRQLISFARALVADPRLLILDEATSSVDLRAEARIEAALETLLAGPHRDRHRPPLSARSATPTASWCSRRGGSWSRAPTTSWWPRAAATPSSTATGSRSRADLAVRWVYAWRIPVNSACADGNVRPAEQVVTIRTSDFPGPWRPRWCPSGNAHDGDACSRSPRPRSPQPVCSPRAAAGMARRS